MKDGLPVAVTILGTIACVVFSLFLMMSGAGDHAESYRALIITGSIILGSGVISSARRQKNK